MHKKRYKLKNKKVAILVISIIFILVIGLSFVVHTFYNNETLKMIKQNYNEYVLTTKRTRLYNKNKKQIGTISSNYYLELDKISKLTTKNKYLKIKGTDYYVSYRNIKKAKKLEARKIDSPSYYLDLNRELKTTKTTTLYKDNEKVITINKSTVFNINSIDDDYYYVSFLNDIFRIKKNKSIKLIDNTKKNDNSFVSVILYDQISDDCDSDTCFIPNSVKAHITTLKKNDYYFITLDDYTKYLKGYVNLKEKAVLLITNSDTKDIDSVKITSVKDNSSLKFTNSNKKSTRNDKLTNINNYYPKKYMVIDEYLNMASGKDVVDDGGENTATSIPVVNYHFFFDSSLGESCNESICLEAKKLEEHLKWLKDNNYKTLTINEFADWKDGYIELPDKSVLLTIDDGAKGTGKHNGHKLIPLLEKYQEHATLFLITGWWDLSNYQSPYLDVQSHTHNLHFEAQCADGRGKVACSDYKTVKADLEQSLKVLNDTTSFCFPFYSYDNESLQALRDLNFRIAFIGGNTNAKRSQDNLLITRYPILNDITLKEFISIVE